MELALNLWPIFDAQTELVQRFAARAYAFDSDDIVISNTLRALANTDFVLARQFPIPKNYILVFGERKVEGAVFPSDFNRCQSSIVEEALQFLEDDLPMFHGIFVDQQGEAAPRRIKVSFPKAYYFVVTWLIEDAAGNLHVHQKPVSQTI